MPRSGASTVWPSRDEVLAYGRRADDAILDAIVHAEFDVSGDDHRAMRRGEALFTALEHEAMHQETLLYMWHRLPYDQKRKPSGVQYELGAAPPAYRTVQIPDGIATLGARRDRITFGWDNEFEAHDVHVPAFEIDVHDVTNADFLAFVDAGGYTHRGWWSDAEWAWLQQEGLQHPNFWVRRGGEWFWRGMFEDIPLPGAWPVFVSHAEASAYARWKGRRLPTEPEFHRAAWGGGTGDAHSGSPDTSDRLNLDFRSWEPVPAGSRPESASAYGVQDLIGNGWEWTSTIFGPFPGFRPMASYPEYSADFFDGEHYVLKGASPVTARELLRRSFRNWFRPHYPYVYAKFRTVSR